MGWGALLPAAQGLEVYVEESQRRTLRWEDQRLEEAVSASDAGIGLRLFDPHTRFVSLEARQPLTRGLTGEEARRFLAHAKNLGGGRRTVVPRKETFVPPSPLPASPSLETKRKVFLRADRTARRDPRVRQVCLTGGELTKNIAGLTPEGRLFSEQRSYATFVVHVTAEKGRRRQTGYEVVAVLGGWENLAPADFSRLADRAARRALAKLEAPPAPLGEMAVVIASEAGGTLIHEAVGIPSKPMLFWREVLPITRIKWDGWWPMRKFRFGTTPPAPASAGRSVLTMKGLRPNPRFSSKTACCALIFMTVVPPNGVECPSNGHGRRESFAHVPIPAHVQHVYCPGPDDPQLILRELKKGIYVTRMGGGQVNTATGDFVFEVEEGFWVENGKVRHPIRGANLLGNGPDVLRSIDRVGWDLGWSVGTCGKEGQGVPVSDGLPTLRIPRVVVGGSA
jgi:TldD protein